jgi:hypothetical protein
MNLNYSIDGFFFIDIIVNFNSAYTNESYEVIDDRKKIAKQYLLSWFLVDFLSIVPFELIVMFMDSYKVKTAADLEDSESQAKINQMIRITRVSKLYKLVKITRLIRMFKIAKHKKKIQRKMTSVVKFGAAFERLSFFILSLLLVCHLIGCLWIYLA